MSLHRKRSILRTVISERLDDFHERNRAPAKGVVGEPEYEVGAALRNPFERPELFMHRATITRRVDRFARELHLDTGRILGWAFAQAVLAAVWAVEDGCLVRPESAWLLLAHNVRPMLKGVIDAPA